MRLLWRKNGNWLDLILIGAVAFAVRFFALPAAFDTSDKLLHPFAAINMSHLPWLTETLRHSKLGTLLTYPYGAVLPLYYAWFAGLGALGIPITERSIGLLVALLGSVVPLLCHHLALPCLGRGKALAAALIVALWHGHILRSASPYSVVLTLGMIGILAVTILLLDYARKPSPGAGSKLAAAILLHFVSCQTAILLAPVWALFIWKARPSLKELWKDRLIPVLAAGFGVLLLTYALAYAKLGNPYVTVVGKLFSKNGHHEFAPLHMARSYLQGIGWLSAAILLAALWSGVARARRRDSLIAVLLIAWVTYTLPLLFLSKATVVSAYAYESQGILLLAGILSLGALENRSYPILALILSFMAFETGASFVTRWPARMGWLGIERDYSLSPGDDAKAAGSLLRREYPADITVVTDLEPILSNFYFGKKEILALYDGDAAHHRRLISHVMKERLADVAVFERGTVAQVERERGSPLCVEWVVGGKAIVNLAQKGPCATREAPTPILAAGFNADYHSLRAIHPAWVPYPYPQTPVPSDHGI